MFGLMLGLIFITMTIQLHYWIYSMSSIPLTPVTLGGLEMRGHHLMCVTTAGTVSSWVKARNTFLEIHPKQLAEWHYFIVALNTVITKLSVISWENRKNNASWGGGLLHVCWQWIINLWIGSLIRILFPLHFKLLIWWPGLQASLIFCLFSPLMLIAFAFSKDSLWQNWFFWPQQF